MKRRNNKATAILLILFAILILGFALFYIDYRQSAGRSNNSAQTVAAKLEATALATITR